MGITDGARLMRTSYNVVRREPALLWFPVISTACLALTAGYWILEGAWLYRVSGRSLFFVPLVIAGLYSLTFVGVFFSVALAGAAADVLNGGAGRDTINAKDGTRDVVNCGAGNDTVTADRTDVLVGCEHVKR